MKKVRKKKCCKCFVAYLLVAIITSSTVFGSYQTARKVEAFAFAIPLGFTALEYLGGLALGIGAGVGVKALADNFTPAISGENWRSKLKVLGKLAIKYVTGSSAENLTEEKEEKKAAEIIDLNVRSKTSDGGGNEDGDNDNGTNNKKLNTAVSLWLTKQIMDFYDRDKNGEDDGMKPGAVDKTFNVPPILTDDMVTDIDENLPVTVYRLDTTLNTYLADVTSRFKSFALSYFSSAINSGSEKPALSLPGDNYLLFMYGNSTYDYRIEKPSFIDDSLFKFYKRTSAISFDPICFVFKKGSPAFYKFFYKLDGKVHESGIYSDMSFGDLHARYYRGVLLSASNGYGGGSDFLKKPFKTLVIPEQWKNVPCYTEDVARQLYNVEDTVSELNITGGGESKIEIPPESDTNGDGEPDTGYIEVNPLSADDMERLLNNPNEVTNNQVNNYYNTFINSSGNEDGQPVPVIIPDVHITEIPQIEPNPNPDPGTNPSQGPDPGGDTNPTQSSNPNPGGDTNPSQSPNPGGDTNPSQSPNPGGDTNPSQSPNPGGDTNPSQSPDPGGDTNPSQSPDPGGDTNPSQSPNPGGDTNPSQSPNPGGDTNPSQSPNPGGDTNPSQSPDPGGDTNPSQSPNPGGDTNPSQSPDPGGDTNPSQSPDPGGDTNPGSNSDFLMPDPRDLFPFCLPFDLMNLIGALMAEPETPYFEIPLKIDTYGIKFEYTFVIDLSDFDGIFKYVRIAETLSFILFLVLITRKIMGD